MIIERKIEIDAGHRIPNHGSKCFHCHGHRYAIICGVDGSKNQNKGAQDEGMVIDYSEIKKILIEEIHNKYDHKFFRYENDRIFYVNDSDRIALGIIDVSFIPTAENLAQWWGINVSKRLKEKGVKLAYLKVYETPNSTALYEEN